MSAESPSTPSPAFAASTGVACPLCVDDLAARSRSVASDTASPRVGFQLCPTCDALLPIDADPTVEEPIDDPTAARDAVGGLMANAPDVAWEIAEYLPAPTVAGPVIDLGVGRGALAGSLQSLGYTVVGCEPSAFLCQMARASYLLGPTTLTNTDPDTFLTGLEEGGQRAAAVVLWHVMEHHDDPLGLLRRCAALAAGGVLVVEVPVAGLEPDHAERSVLPTPATLAHLATELDVELVAASVVDEASLRATFAVPAADVVDLEPRAHVDVTPVELAYRAASPAFDALAPSEGDEARTDTPVAAEGQDAVAT